VAHVDDEQEEGRDADGRHHPGHEPDDLQVPATGCAGRMNGPPRLARRAEGLNGWQHGFGEPLSSLERRGHRRLVRYASKQPLPP